MRGEPQGEIADRVSRPVRVAGPLQQPRLLEGDLPIVREPREVAVERGDRAVGLAVRLELEPERARRLARGGIRRERLPVRLDRRGVVPDLRVGAAPGEVPGLGDAGLGGRGEQRGREERRAGDADHGGLTTRWGAGERSSYAAT